MESAERSRKTSDKPGWVKELLYPGYCSPWMPELRYWSAAITTAPKSRPDILIENFKGKDFGEWTVDGEAFGSPISSRGPTRLLL